MHNEMLCFGSPLAISIILTVTFIIVQLLLQLWLEWSEERETRETYSGHHYINFTISSMQEVQDVVLLWWTPFTGNRGSYLKCGSISCFVTQDRRFRHHPQFQMFLFYGSNVDVLDLPLPRRGMDRWALLHEESPKNVPFLSHNEALSYFNYTSTFSRFSDVPLTLQYLYSLKSLTDSFVCVPLEEKNKLLKDLAPVLYIQSDCDTPLDRDAYVKELMKYINIDSYGICLHNKELPPSLSSPMESMESPEFFKFVAKYKFTIAFENAVCEDYITEKLWRPLSVGSVPIYMGSPSVQDWLPNNTSAILASDFESPKDLAAFLSFLNENDAEYMKYLSHKNGFISNPQLLFEMASRVWSPSVEAQYHFVNHFECEMCRKAHLSPHRKEVKTATEQIYNCSLPISSLTRMLDPSNPWVNQWHFGRCEASVLSLAIQNGDSFIDNAEFYGQVHTRFKQGLC